MDTTIIKKVLVPLGPSLMASCTDNNEFTNEQITDVPQVTSSSLLQFSNREELKNSIENGMSSTRSSKAGFISLMDEVRENDPILSQFSTEEKNYIKENRLSYYDVLGYEDIIPNENFAHLLNLKGEVQVNDSIYRITRFGTLCTSVQNAEELEIAYKQLQQAPIEFSTENSVAKITENVNLINSYNRISYNEEGDTDNTPIMTRTATEGIPYNTFPHFSSESHTFFGKLFGKLFGDKSVKTP